MGTSNVTQKGQVTIPVEIRRALGLKTGSKVRFRRHGRKVTLEAVDEPAIDTVFGIYTPTAHHGVPDIDEALDELRLERARRKQRS